LHLQHTRHQFSLDGAGLRGLDVVSENFSSDILRIYVSLQAEPRFIRKQCQLRIDVTFGDRLHKPTAKTNPARWMARLQGVRGLLLFYV
jgi:hypothetical protein